MIRFWIRHPVATWMLFSALIICGVYALPRLTIEAMPEMELPSLSVYTVWNGASPKAIQRSITVPIEEAVRRVHGVEEVTSRSWPGRSRVSVSFQRDINLDFARLDLSEQLGAVRRTLPASATQPTIVPYVPEEFRTEDFFTVSLISPLSTNELREKAETWLIPRLLAVPGVADAELQGGARPVLRVLLDFERMERYGLTADGIYERIQQLDDIIPAGAVRRRGQELTVSVQDSVVQRRLEETVLRTLGDQAITLGHVGEIEPGYEDPIYFVRINGENVISASIAKRSGHNAVTVSRELRRALPRVQAQLPFPLEFEIDQDQGEELEDKLEELIYRSLVILGLLFLLLALALRRVRLTAIVIFSILLAIVIALSLFYFFGVSVNFITISGLTVCFGMLLDNSILVLDAIHRRLTRRRGADTETALVAGTKEVAFPILTTTLTTVVAFLSFSFLSGRLSLYYVPLAASVGIAMLASIFVAFCWIPVALRGPASKEAQRSQREGGELIGWPLFWRWSLGVVALAVLAGAGFTIFKDFGAAVDHWPWAVGISGLALVVGLLVSHIESITALQLRFWWVVLPLFLGLMGAAGYIYKEEVQKGGFWRQGEREELVVYCERPVGTDVLLTTETIRLFEQEILPLPEGIKARSWSQENRGVLRVTFEPEMLRTEYPELYRNKLILLAEELGGMFVYIGGFGDPYLKGGMGGGMSNSLIRITGYNSATLNEIAEGVMARLERNRRVRNVRLTSGDQFERSSSDETVIQIKRDVLRAHRLSVAEVVGHLRRLLGIETPWHMIIDGEDQRLQLAFADSERMQYDRVAASTMTTARGERVRLGDLVTLETRPVVGSINRRNQRYTMQINWEYIGTDRMRQSYIGTILDGMELPYGYTAEDVSGERMTAEEEEEMQTVLLLTVLFIFMTLAALFESVTLPFLVLLAVPMALSGVVAIFWATGAAFDSSAKIGLVLLFGIVVNNAILLVNRFRLQVRELVADGAYPPAAVPPKDRLGGVDLWRLPGVEGRRLLRRAICEGTRIQLRSILLTSGTTVAGLIPLLVQITDSGQGRDIWENLALSSIGGLVSGTVLIIGAMPALYWALSRVGWGLMRLWQRMRGRAATAAVGTERVGAESV